METELDEGQIELPKIKSHHIKFTEESAQWSIPASNLIFNLMMQESCLIYFYSTQHQTVFQSFISRSTQTKNVEKKQIKPETWVFGNKKDPVVMEAMAELPKLSQNIHLAPSLKELLENGVVDVYAIEDTCIICKRYYKTPFFRTTKKPLMMYSKNIGYTMAIVDFSELSPEDRQASLLEE